ncbi:hypothetical protein BGW36DRAFT_380582 [Talaromyces proteolyticus]|uniref:FAD-binding domain-containing protein n=1 Tax=Talaromyces proteolyticus TaxID=1131652 RepID=A0AAD4KMP4_9EURO|nr:uncharacterized protein BGW36DRAFT_380582 [Talaromyces proteolyticus]KAH8696267.1 hypothetical protein BGW36DRAFT_380582 [Talaromyces proteolyticus]
MTQIPQVNGFPSIDGVAEVYSDYLIVGTGPAGASLTCFLAHYGETQTAYPQITKTFELAPVARVLDQNRVFIQD